MSKEKNVVQKFRELWKSLNIQEREDLWDILTALRGSDSGENDTVKDITTARIRGELLGEDFRRGFVYLSLAEAMKCHALYSFKKIKESYREKSWHFRQHIHQAIEALNRYRPKKSMRDLQKYLKY